MIDEALWQRVLSVSAMSFWEIGMLMSKRHLALSASPGIWRQEVLELGIEEIPMTGGIGIISTELEGLPGGPSDRIIVATAMTIGATLVTADAQLLRWNGVLDRRDARI